MSSRNLSYQSMMNQFQDFVQFYKNLYFEMDELSHTQRFIIILMVIFLIYYILKFFFNKIYQRISFYNEDFQLYTNLISGNSDFPNNGLIYNENNDKIPGSFLKLSNDGFHTYSFFVYVSSLNYNKDPKNPYSFKPNIPSYIFVRGQYNENSLDPSNKFIFENMTPGVILDTSSNSIKFMYSNSAKNDIQSIPSNSNLSVELDTWVHFGIVCANGRSLTIYKNGEIVNLITMDNFQLQNEQNNDLYLYPNIKSQNNILLTQGFYGSLGLFLYHDGIYTPAQMKKIYQSQKKVVDEWDKKRILKIMQ